jgi:hypothetical protein
MPNYHQNGTATDQMPCDCGLLPRDSGDVVLCVLPYGHEGLHQTPRGVRWADPLDDESEDWS